MYLFQSEVCLDSTSTTLIRVKVKEYQSYITVRDTLSKSLNVLGK